MNCFSRFIFSVCAFTVTTLCHVSCPVLAEELHLPTSQTDSYETVCTHKTCVPDKVTFFDTTLTLRGHELFTWYFFKIYVASFYSEHPIPSLDKLFDIPGDKYLRLEYLRSIEAKDFIKSSEDAFKKNPDSNPDTIRAELQKLYDAYEPVEKGDTYALYFTQENMTTCLFKNDVRKVCIEGETFARAYFGIWLSEHSLNNEFSKKLISRK
jgi:hypothetical protein